MERATSTLNVYPDNRIGFEATPTMGPSLWAWSTDQNKILGLAVNGRVYNAKDISLVSVTDTTKPTYRHLKVQLKSGEDVQADFQFRSSAVTWVSCTPEKTCIQKVPDKAWYAAADPSVSHLGDLLTAIYESDFSTWPPHPLKDRLLHPSPDLYSENTVRFLSDDDMAALQNRLDRRQLAWAQVEQDNARKRDAERAGKIARLRTRELEAAEMRKHIHVGTMTNCGEVFEVRLPMVGVQTIKGMQFIDVSRLYAPTANCMFLNDQYVGPSS